MAAKEEADANKLDTETETDGIAPAAKDGKPPILCYFIMSSIIYYHFFVHTFFSANPYSLLTHSLTHSFPRPLPLLPLLLLLLPLSLSLLPSLPPSYPPCICFSLPTSPPPSLSYSSLSLFYPPSLPLTLSLSLFYPPSYPLSLSPPPTNR